MAQVRVNIGGVTIRTKLANKTMAIASAVAIFLFLVIDLIFPTIFFQIMRPYLVSNVANVLSLTTVKESYVWRNNRIVFSIGSDEDLRDLLDRYFTRGEREYSELIPRISSMLELKKIGVLADFSRNTIGSGSIVSISYPVLFTEDGDFFYHPESREIAKLFRRSAWFQSFDLTDSDFFDYMPFLPSEHKEISGLFGMIAGFHIKGKAYFLANLIDFHDIQVLFRDLRSIGMDDYIITKKGTVLFQNLENSSIDIGALPDDLFQGGQYETRVWQDGSDTYIAALSTYESEDQRSILFASRKQLLEPYSVAINSFHVFVAAMVIILLSIFYGALRGMLVRLDVLEQTMAQVRDGNYRAYADISGNDEIANLATSFNTMIQRIHKDDRLLRAHEDRERRMQYSLMVAAVDPHFIYNTLNTISALAEFGDTKSVVEVNNALIGTLKDRLKVKALTSFDTIAVEQTALEQYIRIQHFMIHQELSFQFHVEKSLLSRKIPKSIIQPLVENSIKHGILPKRDLNGRPTAGFISVEIVESEDRLIIRVQDDGVGISLEAIERYFECPIPETHASDSNYTSPEHISIQNIRIRLEYLFPGSHQCSCKSMEGQGTRVEISFPIGIVPRQ